MKISVFGLGYVGNVCIGCLSELGHQLIGVDIHKGKISSINAGKPSVFEKDLNGLFKTNFSKDRISATNNNTKVVIKTDISLICVGTPNNQFGHLDTSAVEKVVSEIGQSLIKKDSYHTIIIRSTVPPGTIKRLEKILEKRSGKKANKDFGVVMNPEFLREGSAINDFFNPPYILIGTSNNKAYEIVKEMYSGINCEMIQVAPEISEIIKFVNNSFHALKITFANEIGNICKKLNIDSHDLMEIFSKDKILNISTKYLKPGFAYGGSCLPKDLEGLISISKDLKVKTPVLESIKPSNDYQIDRLNELIINLKSQSLGFLGITFKKGTDDVRNSPVIKVINHFLTLNYQITIFDNNIKLSELDGSNKKYLTDRITLINEIFLNNSEEVCRQSELIIISNGDEKYFIDDHHFSGKIVVDLSNSFPHLSAVADYYNLN